MPRRHTGAMAHIPRRIDRRSDAISHRVEFRVSMSDTPTMNDQSIGHALRHPRWTWGRSLRFDRTAGKVHHRGHRGHREGRTFLARVARVHLSSVSSVPSVVDLL